MSCDGFWGVLEGEESHDDSPSGERRKQQQVTDEAIRKVGIAISTIIDAAQAGDTTAREICFNEGWWIRKTEQSLEKNSTPKQLAKKVFIATNIIIEAAKTSHEGARKICQTEGWNWDQEKRSGDY
jgi:hypothetical protein